MVANKRRPGWKRGGGTYRCGNVLADGDAVTLVKDLTVKGAGQVLKQGTLIKSIRLPNPDEGRDAQEIDCKFEGIKGLVLRAEFVRKLLGGGLSALSPKSNVTAYL